MIEVIPTWTFQRQYYVAGIALNFAADIYYKILLDKNTFAFNTLIIPNQWRFDNSLFSSKPIVDLGHPVTVTPYGIIQDEIPYGTQYILITGVSPDTPSFYLYADAVNKKPSIGSIDGRYK